MDAGECRTDVGYASVPDVVSMEKSDEMHSFFLPETLKYLYLLFTPSETIDFAGAIFMTEAHRLLRGAIGPSEPSAPGRHY